MVASVVVDTSAWIELFNGAGEDVDRALAAGGVAIPPLVVAELVTGATSIRQRQLLGELLQNVPLHPTPLEHWIAVGDLRRLLARKGLAVTIPDAHVAQCALDGDAVLITRDAVFAKIARHTSLRLQG